MFKKLFLLSSVLLASVAFADPQNVQSISISLDPDIISKNHPTDLTTTIYKLDLDHETPLASFPYDKTQNPYNISGDVYYAGDTYIKIHMVMSYMSNNLSKTAAGKLSAQLTCESKDTYKLPMSGAIYISYPADFTCGSPTTGAKHR